MSTQSLPKLLNGGGLSSNHVINMKYATLSRVGVDKTPQIPTRANRTSMNGCMTLDRNNNSMLQVDSYQNGGQILPPARKKSLFVNKFRGVKKEELDKQANKIIYSMTVGTN